MKRCLLDLIKKSVFKCKDLKKGIEFTGHATHIQASEDRKLYMMSGDSTSTNLRSHTGIFITVDGLKKGK